MSHGSRPGEDSRRPLLTNSPRDEELDSQNHAQIWGQTRLKWKIDLLILPLLASIFFLGTLGSYNIGNAKEAGLDEDLDLSPQMFSNIVSAFLVGFIIGQLPGTLLLRQIGPQRQFAGAMVLWGVFTVFAAFAQSYATMLLCRFLTGFAEALVQGGVLYLSFWYEPTEFGTRAAILSAVTSLSGACGNVGAYVIQKRLEGSSGMSAWRWMFLVEGIVPVVWSVVIFLFLPASPDKAYRGFSKSEREQLVQRAARAQNSTSARFQPRLVHRVLLDPQWWLFAGIQSSFLLCGTTTSNFLPAIFAGFGFTGADSQLMSVIPCVVYFVIAPIVSHLSDLTRVRSPWILGCAFVAAVGYGLLLTSAGLTTRLIAVCMVTVGATSPAVICFAWLTSANVGYTFRGSAMGFLNIVSYVAALEGQQAFIDPPLYHRGLKVSLCVLCMSMVLTVVLLFYFMWANTKKRRAQASDEAEILRRCSMDDIGNKHPDFFFTY